MPNTVCTHLTEAIISDELSSNAEIIRFCDVFSGNITLSHDYCYWVPGGGHLCASCASDQALLSDRVGDYISDWMFRAYGPSFGLFSPTHCPLCRTRLFPSHQLPEVYTGFVGLTRRVTDNFFGDTMLIPLELSDFCYDTLVDNYLAGCQEEFIANNPTRYIPGQDSPIANRSDAEPYVLIFRGDDFYTTRAPHQMYHQIFLSEPATISAIQIALLSSIADYFGRSPQVHTWDNDPHATVRTHIHANLRPRFPSLFQTPHPSDDNPNCATTFNLPTYGVESTQPLISGYLSRQLDCTIPLLLQDLATQDDESSETTS